MRFGILYEMQRPFEGSNIDWNTLYKETLEQCELADKVGTFALPAKTGGPAPQFAGMSRIEQHRRVYAVFGAEIGGPIHALSLETRAE